jgi:uncharacterized membrane protein YvlD (DUF360 family)
MDAGSLMGLVIGILIGALISGAVIWLVGKMNLGLKVDNFGSAMIAGVLIGLLTTVLINLIPGAAGVVGFIVRLVVSAGAIYVGAQVLKGLHVEGFKGAVIAALAIAAVYFVLGLLAVGVVTTTTA